VKDESKIIEGPKLTLILLPPKQIFIPHKIVAQMKNALKKNGFLLTLAISSTNIFGLNSCTSIPHKPRSW
jgi:hypothetical protein